MRDILLETVKKLYPDIDIQPETDFAILQLSGGGYSTDQGDVQEWLDNQYTHLVEAYGGGDVGKQRLEQSVQQTMSLNSDQIIGMKPLPGASDVLIRQIPESEYCFRLWPGSASMKQYCLDFVLSSNTAQPVNSTADFSLWSPIPSFPSLPTELMQVFSLEENMGIPRNDIRSGEERFILVEGQDCLLKRSGFKNVSFKVPIRSPIAPPFPGADFVDFSN